MNLIQTSGLNQDQQIMMQRFLETTFKDTIQLNGDQRQLDYLSIILNNTLSINSNGNSNNNTSNLNNSAAHYSSYISSA
jgi:hypothetical protein